MKYITKDPIASLVRLLYAILAIIIVIFVFPKAVPCILPFFFAWIITLIIKPVSGLLEKLGIGRRISVVLSMLMVLGVLCGVLYLLSSAVIKEIRTVAEMFSDTRDGIPVFLWDIVESLPKNMQGVAQQLLGTMRADISEILYPAIQSALPKLGGAAGKLPSAFVFMVVLIMAIYFLSYDESGLRNEIKKFLPESAVNGLRSIRTVLHDAFGGYFKAQLIIMCVVFTILFIGFLILDVKLALLLALVISILDAIPVLGTGMVLNPWAVLCLVQGDYVCAVGFVTLYIIVLFTRNFIEPKVLSGQLGIHPLITLVSMYAGLKLVGVIGMIIGPITALIVINILKMKNKEAEANVSEQCDSNS